MPGDLGGAVPALRGGRDALRRKAKSVPAVRWGRVGPATDGVKTGWPREQFFIFSKNPVTSYPMGSSLPLDTTDTSDTITTTMDALNPNPVGADVTLTSETDTKIELPDWLDPAPRTLAKSPPEVKALALAQYEHIFMRVIESIAHGQSLSQILRDDQRDIDYNDFYRWIKRDPQRNQLFTEAQEMRTEFMAGEIIEIADADDSLEDVQRSRLKIDTRKWLMGAHNRKKYGETKTVELGGSISITDALANARARIVEAEVIDVEIKD